jgi:probable HAF family extracellular repeat protein
LNEHGQATITLGTVSEDRHAALWEDGRMTDLGALGGGGQSVALDIDDGQAIGFRHEPGGTTTGLLWTVA